MGYSITLNFKYLSMKMNWEIKFSIEKKLNFESSGNSAHTT